jgi:hypothetical protein
MAKVDHWLAAHKPPVGVEARRVALDHEGRYIVSTVQLVADHPVRGVLEVFETRVFGSEVVEAFKRRYETAEEAAAGHEEALAKVRAWVHRRRRWPTK